MTRPEKRKLAAMLLVIMSAPVLGGGLIFGLVLCHGPVCLWETLSFLPMRDQWLLVCEVAALVIGFAIYPYRATESANASLSSPSEKDGVWPPAPTVSKPTDGQE